MGPGGFRWQSCRVRRRFVTNAAVAGVAGLGGFGVAGLRGLGKPFAKEPAPEITTIRFEKDDADCIPPQIADALLRAEGFTDIRYVELTEAHVRNGGRRQCQLH